VKERACSGISWNYQAAVFMAVFADLYQGPGVEWAAGTYPIVFAVFFSLGIPDFIPFGVGQQMDFPCKSGS
jgi:hypothetical protein